MYWLLLSKKSKSSICTRIHFRRRKSRHDASAVITIYFFNKNIDAKEATYQKTEQNSAHRRAETDKYCTYNVTENPNGNRKNSVVDFYYHQHSKR